MSMLRPLRRAARALQGKALANGSANAMTSAMWTQRSCSCLAADAAAIRAPLRSRRLLHTSAVRMDKDSKHKTAPLASNKDDDDEDEDEDSGGEDEDEDEDDEDDEEEEDGDEEEGDLVDDYLGVTYHPDKVKKYSAELTIEGHVISGGDHWTALDAAKAYDELVDLYCDLETPRNFSGSVAGQDFEDAAAPAEVSEWEVPDAGKRHADIIPPIPQRYLTIDEVKVALENEKALNVHVVDLAGKSSLADYMVFTTGRSQAHMRRMADMMILSMRARQIEDEFEYSVEGRDCDDWMIADCNNIVVHFMRDDTRRILNLEDHWENMVNDKHRVYGDMTEDEYMDKYGTSELMDYIEDEDHPNEDSVDGSGVEWK